MKHRCDCGPVVSLNFPLCSQLGARVFTLSTDIYQTLPDFMFVSASS